MKASPAGVALLLCCCAPGPPDTAREGPPIELAGRLIGPPQRCVALNQLDALRASENDPHTLIYGSGRVIFANHLGQCRFGNDDVLVTEPTGSELCAGDIVRSFDRNSRIAGPSCVLSDFIPYRR